MHTMNLLQRALELAESMGYGIRQEWLGGAAGGTCEIAGKKWLFVDVSLSPGEQLEQVTDAIQGDPALHTIRIPDPLEPYVGLRKRA